MQFILTITNTNRKNLFFIANDSQVFSLLEALSEVFKNNVDNTYIVNRKTGSYLRTKPSVSKENELESISISAPSLFLAIDNTYAVNYPPLLKRYINSYINITKDNGSYITPIGGHIALIKNIKRKILDNKKHIFDSADYFNIDPYLIGAILIDEIARLAPFENIIDKIGGSLVGRNISVGLAQIKLQTANDLIIKEIYNPNTKDKKLPFLKLDNEAYKYLYQYVNNPKHNIFFAGAFIRYTIDFWLAYFDLPKHTEIIATLYHQGYSKPHNNPKPNECGKQIIDEFYPIAKKWLTEKQ